MIPKDLNITKEVPKMVDIEIVDVSDNDLARLLRYHIQTLPMPHADACGLMHITRQHLHLVAKGKSLFGRATYHRAVAVAQVIEAMIESKQLPVPIERNEKVRSYERSRRNYNRVRAVIEETQSDGSLPPGPQPKYDPIKEILG